MDCTATLQLYGLLAVNSKLYSPRGGSIPKGEDAGNCLKFSLLLSEDVNKVAGLKLLVQASRPIRKEDGPSQTSEYEASMFFAADGLFNFNYITPNTAFAIASIFHVPIQHDVTSLRCLNFAASEFSICMSKVPRLRTEEMSIELARLFNTARNAIHTQEAILDISFLIYSADHTTDTTIANMEQVLFKDHRQAHAYLTVKVESPPEPKPLSLPRAETLPSVISLDMLSHIYRNKSFTNNEGFISPRLPQARNNLSTNAYIYPRIATWSSPFSTSPKAKSEGMPTNKFQENSPPISLNPKDGKGVCFNCYAVGHREDECMKPRRVSGIGKKGHKASKTASGDFVGKGLAKKKGSDDLRGNVVKG